LAYLAPISINNPSLGIIVPTPLTYGVIHNVMTGVLLALGVQQAKGSVILRRHKESSRSSLEAGGQTVLAVIYEVKELRS
jgi:hypothetical protein